MSERVLDISTVAAAIDRYESGDLDFPEILALFGALISSGLAWQLQGHYGRTAKDLMAAGWLDRNGNIAQELT